eukprot:2677013-Pleurochrysis_carterae.AAC.1
MDEMVALVASEVAQASTVSCRNSSRPLPALDAEYVRRAAWLVMVSRIAFIISGANMKRFDSSGVSGGGRGMEPGAAVSEREAEVAVAAGAALAPESAWERVCGPAAPAAA